MAQRPIGEAVRRVAQQIAAADLNAAWGRVQQDPVDEAALRELVDRWGPGFLGYCRAVLRDAHAAEDVVSAGFATLIRHRSKPPTAEDALRYLWKTVARAARRARWRIARRAGHEQPGDVATAPDPRDSDPASRAERAEVMADVSAALGQLSENERCAVVLVSFLGHTEEQAAAVMECGRSSVSTYLTRAKEKLGRLLVRYKDAVGAAGGVATVDAALTEAARAASLPTPTAALIESILRQAAAPVKSASGWAKAAVVLLILGAAGGATLAMWPKPQPPDPPPAIAANPPPVPAPVESVPDRNRRLFSTEVLPRQLAALQKLVPEGEVVLRTVDVFDVRVNCEYELRHNRNEPRGLVSALRFEHISYVSDKWPQLGRSTGVFWDRLNHHKWEVVGTDSKSLILWPNPLWARRTLSIKVGPSLEDAVTAFDHLPADELARAEYVQTQARIKAAAAPYLGAWYVRGDPRQPRQIELKDEGDGVISGVLFRGVPPPGEQWMPLYVRGWTRVGPDGRLIGLNYYPNGGYVSPYGHAVTLSTDGQRLDFEATREWWSREPVIEPKK